MYGQNKQRSMLRSLLPSSSRKKAREDKKYAHKDERSKARAALHGIVDLESAEECDTDLFYSCDPQMREIVNERRGADKTAPFERWIEAVTDHIEDPHEKWDYAKGLLPANLIGDHALTHLPYEWDPDEFKYRYRRYGRSVPEDRQHQYLALYEALYEACVRPGMHKRLNAVLKDHFSRSTEAWINRKREWVRCECGKCEHVRCLGGIGDIESFIEDWHARAPGVPGVRPMNRTLMYHGSSWQEMIAFLRDEGVYS